jgi:hypothetical protein
MEDSTFPSVGASFKKWGCYRHTPLPLPKEAQALARAFKKILKKVSNFFIKKGCSYLDRQRPMAGGRPLIAACRGCPPGNCSSTSDRRPFQHRSLPLLYPCLPLSCLLSQKICTCGLLFLIGSSTCPSSPDFY